MGRVLDGKRRHLSESEAVDERSSDVNGAFARVWKEVAGRKPDDYHASFHGVSFLERILPDV